MVEEDFQYEVFSNYVRPQFRMRNISAISHGCLMPLGKIKFIYLIKCTLHVYMQVEYLKLYFNKNLKVQFLSLIPSFHISFTVPYLHITLPSALPTDSPRTSDIAPLAFAPFCRRSISNQIILRIFTQHNCIPRYQNFLESQQHNAASASAGFPAIRLEQQRLCHRNHPGIRHDRYSLPGQELV